MKDQDPFSPFVQGERLYLREVRPADVNEAYYRWMNDPGVTRYLESRFFPNDADSLRDYVRDRLKDRNSVFLAIVLKEGDRHIGNIKLGPIDWIHRLADVGVLIGEKDCWGKGYASEAIGLVVRLAFSRLNLHKLTAGFYAANKGSEKAFGNNGFVVEGIRKSHRFCEGSYTDTVILGLTRDEESGGTR
jgi:[ribosomal protein S5]-alanine N-acetyltransferase